MLKIDILKELSKDTHWALSTLPGKRNNIILPNFQKVHGIEDILVGEGGTRVAPAILQCFFFPSSCNSVQFHPKFLRIFIFKFNCTNYPVT